jgi:hypothetical protein
MSYPCEIRCVKYISNFGGASGYFYELGIAGELPDTWDGFKKSLLNFVLVITYIQ